MNQIMLLFMCCSYKINEFIQHPSECAYALHEKGEEERESVSRN